jgi:hypothetical protein
MISLDTALAYSSNPEELQEMINRGTGLIQAPVAARTPGRG